MTQRVSRDQYPWWVRFTLLGARARTALRVWAVTSLVLGAVLVAFGLWSDSAWSISVGLIGGPLAAVMYWLTIRWIDQHGSWDDLR